MLMRYPGCSGQRVSTTYLARSLKRYLRTAVAPEKGHKLLPASKLSALSFLLQSECWLPVVMLFTFA